MDYDSIHGPGVSNFSPPSSSSAHRMPTVSAAQALQDQNSSSTRCISTRLRLLDYALQNREPEPLNETAQPFFGGVSRGKVTEIYGPPGIGKTTLGMQLASSALKAGEGVVWLDCANQLSGKRLSQILSSDRPADPPLSSEPQSADPQTLLRKITQFSTHTLSHFIAFVTTPTWPLPDTNLVVIDSFSTLIANTFPRPSDSNVAPRKPGEPNPSARKFAILQKLINTLQKLAAIRNMAVVILSSCVTKMRQGAGAVLVPAINTTSWEQVLGCRVAMFRDFLKDEEGNYIQYARFAQVLKAEGISVPEGRSKVAAFTIDDNGFSAITALTIPTPIFKSPIKKSHPLSRVDTEAPNSTPILPVLNPPQKRKFEDTDLEIPDSDDDGYGWDEDDEEELPPQPPQWQGSEDVLGPGLDPQDEDEEFGKDEELDELANYRERSPLGYDRRSIRERSIAARDRLERMTDPEQQRIALQEYFATFFPGEDPEDPEGAYRDDGETVEPEDADFQDIPVWPDFRQFAAEQPVMTELEIAALDERVVAEICGRTLPELINDDDSEDELAA